MQLTQNGRRLFTCEIAGVRNWFPFVGISSGKRRHFLHLAVHVGRADSIYGPGESGMVSLWHRNRSYPSSSAAFSDNNCEENHSGCVIFLFDRSRWLGNVTRKPSSPSPLNERLLRIYLICIPLALEVLYHMSSRIISVLLQLQCETPLNESGIHLSCTLS